MTQENLENGMNLLDREYKEFKEYRDIKKVYDPDYITQNQESLENLKDIEIFNNLNHKEDIET